MGHEAETRGIKIEKKEEKKTTSIVKIEKVNALIKAQEGDILFTSSMDSVHLVATNEGMSNDWILDSGVSFHVSPNCEWFSTYNNAGQTSCESFHALCASCFKF